ncbi:MAG TPA: hypothetical protein VLD38_03855, partial [Nitrosopumilaceae archaeon]|nr:hypothetical protein [Nitrosopumilaceae archaeon]
IPYIYPNILTKKYILIFLSMFVLASSQLASVGAEGEFSLTSKGKISPTSHFPGLVVWNVIKNGHMQSIVQTEDGPLKVEATLKSSDKCEQENLSVCFEGEITNVYRTNAFSQGDTYLLGIDLVNKKMYISFTSGFFENVDISMNLQKIVIS